MALIKCPDCGKEYSDAANNCPNCGRPSQKYEENMREFNKFNQNFITWLVAIFIVLIIIYIIICSNMP